MVRGVVEANVPHVIVVLFPRVLIRGGLENGHYNGAGDAGTRLSCMDHLGLDASEILFHFRDIQGLCGLCLYSNIDLPYGRSLIGSLSEGIRLLCSSVTMRPYHSFPKGLPPERTFPRCPASRPLA